MTESEQAIERLRKIILRDKIECYEGVVRVLRGDIFSLLSCYFGFESDTLCLSLDIGENGKYMFKCSLEAESIISPQILQQNISV